MNIAQICVAIKAIVYSSGIQGQGYGSGTCLQKTSKRIGVVTYQYLSAHFNPKFRDQHG
jgi:hypothetical protein